ncbi:hypothetical protein [Undibacterium sp. Xuan67W]
MWLLAIEAGVAMFLLVFIVWWTMFQGRDSEKAPVKKEQKSDPE